MPSVKIDATFNSFRAEVTSSSGVQTHAQCGREAGRTFIRALKVGTQPGEE
jgi:hypothetical protein